ncbi:MAG: hypothetical protein DCC43_04075 [Candidatus Brocadia sp.]|jgi:ABC-type uncharacterized transport system, periplasmic component|uniref:ABC transporter substrate binding component n=1 Tax=Candidatus Brocadia fulgida TaxID=380242 RepID=A0A0M2UQX4_9BACT|nr:MAG: hypothetical protein BROFUL_02812 [Candidatus Brocadia fulgida]MCC6326197.1 ABC transporter substrate-binding protein [Candidatus Brocadia sp.]MCE7911210.1 hypothetical protein [Candidatus Brocadia sp. AMX3]MBV6518184.1 hypothetical protein [Candidatus Brocadia fulgida]MDG5996869.1 hypothetical protein [Candidatus Brocadia sp.]
MPIILNAFIIAFIIVYINIPEILADEYQIAVLASRNESPYKEVIAGFQKTIIDQRRDTKCNVFIMENDKTQISQSFRDIKKIKPRVLFTVGTAPTVEALKVFTDIPVVATLVLDDDMILHARNATGVILSFPIETQFHLLKNFLPEAKKIGVIYNPAENREKIRSATIIAEKMGLDLHPVDVHSPKDIPKALKTLASGIDILWGINDALVFNSLTAKQILLFSFRNHVPFSGLSSTWVKAGALYALEYDFHDIGVQCGEKSLKILQGAKVNSLPVCLPRKLLYALNLRTARYMKIKFREEHIHNAYQIFDE